MNFRAINHRFLLLPLSKIIGILGLITSGFIFFLMLYIRSRQHESTDNAQVETHIVHISSRISEEVERVCVQDNQEVWPGDILLQLDHRMPQARVAAAQADLEIAQAQLLNSQQQFALLDKNIHANLKQAKGLVVQAVSSQLALNAASEQAQAEKRLAFSHLNLMGNEFQRAQQLFASSVITQAEFENRQAQYEQARAAYQASNAKLTQAREGITQAGGAALSADGRLQLAQTGSQQMLIAESQINAAQARVKQAQALLAQAELNLSYAAVRSPVHGIVSKRSVEAGQMASPERSLLAIASLDDMWVVANFKETQIARIRPGQAVDIEIDAWPERKLTGRVQSFAGASGAKFSLFPPDNASGNFTKVVQRIGVLIHFDKTLTQSTALLRAGMSANVDVKVGKI